jgi:hypothetical protein
MTDLGRFVAWGVCCLALESTATAMPYYVSPNGNDAWSGALGPTWQLGEAGLLVLE